MTVKTIDLTTAREILHDFQEVCRRCDPGDVAALDDDANQVRVQNRMLVKWLTLYAHAVIARRM